MSTSKNHRANQTETHRRGKLVDKSSSFHGQIVAPIPSQLRRPKTVPDLVSHRNNTASPPEAFPRQPPKLLLHVTVLGSLGPVKVVITPESTVGDLVAASVQQYLKEGRRPFLPTTDPSGFDLHYSQFSLESLDREEKLIGLGSRNFLLCPRKSTAAMDGGAGKGGSCQLPFGPKPYSGCDSISLTAMEFWGVEVKAGAPVEVRPEVLGKCIHLSQAALGEAKKDKAIEPVLLYLKFDEQKLVIGTLSQEKFPQLSFDLVLEKKFELSHNWKNGNSEDDDDLPIMTKDNVKPDAKTEVAKASASKSNDVKLGGPKKQVKELLGGNIGSGGESDSDEDDDETPPKKADQGKKRSNESALKTPVPAKKAKSSAPQKTGEAFFSCFASYDGKKVGHKATPYPQKKGGKTPKSETKDQTPKSGGQFTCKSCSKFFTSEGGLQQHSKAKHGGQ
ncbi:Histone deacetylase HDT1 [Senna tora]|uniref:Histone deacetylase HDT1 n=1 Tax=Senna tora TaxID=362788 RepID=A0A834SLP5_9FABA|nr:Histone deacetylase HDT1 [Senna tora]